MPEIRGQRTGGRKRACISERKVRDCSGSSCRMERKICDLHGGDATFNTVVRVSRLTRDHGPKATDGALTAGIKIRRRRWGQDKHGCKMTEVGASGLWSRQMHTGFLSKDENNPGSRTSNIKGYIWNEREIGRQMWEGTIFTRTAPEFETKQSERNVARAWHTRKDGIFKHKRSKKRSQRHFD